MPATLVGLNKARLTRRLFFREPVGLERIQEEYVYSGTSLNNVFVNGVSQPSIIASVAGDGNTYGNMVIERVEFQSLNGGLTLAIVTYVGLHSTQSPAPLISIEPIIDRNWLFHNYAAKVKFVTSLGAPGSNTELNVVAVTYRRGTIHSTVNGVSIPQGVYGPDAYDVMRAGLSWNLSWIGCDFVRYECHRTGGTELNPQGDPTETEIKGTIYYTGFSVFSVSVERFGLYGVISLDIRDQATYLIPYAVYACSSPSYAVSECVSYLNSPASANRR